MMCSFKKVFALKNILVVGIILAIIGFSIIPIKTYYRNLKEASAYKVFLDSYTLDNEKKHELKVIYDNNDFDSIKNIISTFRFFVGDLENDLKYLKSYVMPELINLKEYNLDEIKEKNEKIFKNSLTSFLSDQKIYAIPHIHHRVWITSDENPTEVSPKLLEKYIEGLKVFPKDWKHIFWCLDPNKIPQTIKILSNSPIKIEIRSLKDIMQEMPGKELINRFLKEKYFNPASDLIRRYVVYKFGGLYCDLGLKWLKDPTRIIDKFDRVVCFTKNRCMDITYLANSANQKEDRVLFEVIENFLNLSKDVKKKYSGKDVMRITTAQLGHYLLLTETNENKKVLMLRKDTSYLECSGMNSWRKGTFGNNSIVTSTTEW